MGAARPSPEATSSPIAFSRSPKPPVVRLVTRADRSAAQAVAAIITAASADDTPASRRRKNMTFANNPEMRTGRLESRPAPVNCEREALLALAAALARDDVEVAAVHGLAPIGDQVLGLRQVGRPLLRDHPARGLPHPVELSVALDLALPDRLGDVPARSLPRV